MDGRMASLEGLSVEMLVSRRSSEERPSKREKASVNDISPCSEYTRFTMEGTLRDPFSELAAQLDVPALGALFMNGPLLEPKWSQALGYGLAVIEGDTRVHLYRSGKFVIRRARDREHVNACYGLICDMVRPSLVLPGGLAYFEAMAIHRAFKDETLVPHISKALSWPAEGLPSGTLFDDLMDGPDNLRPTLRETLNPPLKALFSRVARGEAPDEAAIEEIRQRNLSSLRTSIASSKGDGRMMSSSASIHLAADRALDLFREVLPSLKGDMSPLDMVLDLLGKEGSGPGELASFVKGDGPKGTHDRAVIGLIAAHALLP